MSKPIHLKGLNGLRAIAAVSVIISHITLALSEFGLNNNLFGKYSDGRVKPFLLADLGVSIFFSLSGFLITYLLLLEKEKGEIAIKKFYIRRILRIWPLYFLYLALAFTAFYVYSISFDKSTVFYYFVLAANIPYILGANFPLITHYWSLGVEEQFYLFWPWVIKKIKIEKLQRIILTGTVFLIVVWICFFLISKKWGYHLPYQSLLITRFPVMLIGALGAIFYYRKNQLLIRFATSKIIQGICWFIIFLSAINLFHTISIIDHIGIGLVTVCIIYAQVTEKNKMINLENKWCNFLGKISFGLYVYHPLIIFLNIKLFGIFQNKNIGSYLFIYLFIILSTIITAFISFTYFEKWFLKLKSSYTIIETVPSKT
jgi:peptidoglycan/LPS O-acetylase OafA/YrhL